MFNTNKLLHEIVYIILIYNMINHKFFFFKSKNGTTVQALKLEGVEDCILKENDTICLSDNEKRVSLQICKKVNVRIIKQFSNLRIELILFVLLI